MSDSTAAKNKSKYDPEKLRALINANKTAPEIQHELDLSPLTFKAHLLKLINEDKQFYAVKGLSTRTRSTRPICKKNGIMITTKMLEPFPVELGDKFELSSQDGKLILTKI